MGEHSMFRGSTKVSVADTCWPLTAWQTLSTCASTPRWKQGHSAARQLGFVASLGGKNCLSCAELPNAGAEGWCSRCTENSACRYKPGF